MRRAGRRRNCCGRTDAGEMRRRDISGTKLYTEAFKTADGSLTEAWKSAHQGAMNFGQGYVQVILNLNTHGTGELPEQEALEYLAALGVLARWVDACEPVPADAEVTEAASPAE